MDQPLILRLSCASCGANLEVSDDVGRFACAYCGSAQVIERRGGTVVLREVTEAVSRVQVGTDKTAAELALVRLREELAATEADWRRAYWGVKAEIDPRFITWNVVLLFALFLLCCGIFGFVGFAYVGRWALAFGALLVTAAASATLLFMSKYRPTSRSRYQERLDAISRPYSERIERLKQLIEKNRSVVEGQ